MAISKAVEAAKKRLIQVPLAGTTIPHLVRGEDGAGTVILRPASKGTGVIAGGAVRVIVELAGIKDILTKSIRSNNPFSVANATLKALQQLRDRRGVPEEGKGEGSRMAVNKTPKQKKHEADSGELRITLVRSLIGYPQRQRDLRPGAGALRKINSPVVRPDRPEIRGMINKIIHVVKVEVIEK